MSRYCCVIFKSCILSAPAGIISGAEIEETENASIYDCYNLQPCLPVKVHDVNDYE